MSFRQSKRALGRQGEILVGKEDPNKQHSSVKDDSQVTYKYSAETPHVDFDSFGGVASQNPNYAHTLWIGNLLPNVTLSAVKKYLGKFGSF